MGIFGSLIKSVTRIGKALPDFLLGTSAEAIGKGYRATSGSIFAKAKGGFRALEADIAAQSATGGNFFKRTLANLKNTPKDLYAGGKAGLQAAKAAGKSGIWGTIKGVGGAVAKKMPYIGAVLTLALEAPNIYKAFKEGGFKAGMKELGGAGVELGCMAAGTAIGSAICPGIGTLIGGAIGGLVGFFVRGKTHTEKQAEAQAQAEAEPQGAVNYSDDEIKTLHQYGLSDDDIEFAKQNGYSVKDVEMILTQELLQQQNQTQTKNSAATGSKYKDTQAEIEYLERQNQILRNEMAKNQTTTPYTSYQTNPYDIYNPNQYMANMYNPYGTPQNVYSNDLLYKNLFGLTPAQYNNQPRYQFGQA